MTRGRLADIAATSLLIAAECPGRAPFTVKPPQFRPEKHRSQAFSETAPRPRRGTMRRFFLARVLSSAHRRVMVNRIARCVLLSWALTFVGSAAARAQPWEDKMYVNANRGFDLSSRSCSETLTPVIYDERGAVTTTHNIDSGMAPIDVDAGVRIWRGLGAGAGYTRRAFTETATVDARIPHPTLFGQPRFTSVGAPLQHTASALYFHAVFVVPVAPRLDVTLLGGPSFVSVTQDLVTGIQIAESSPNFSTVEVAKVVSVSQNERTLGFVAGGDVTFFITRLLGAGVTVRYVSATVDFPVAAGGTTSYD